jgi:RNA polymerase sigma factor (sigma-70 family)
VARRADGGPEASHESVQRVLVGDPQTVAQITATAGWVVRSSRWGIPASEHADLIQQVLFDIWLAVSRPGFVLEKGLEPFVRTVAYRRCVDRTRRMRCIEPLPDSVPGRHEDPEQVCLRQEMVERGRRVWLRLGESCRELMRLRMVENLSYRCIAESQGRNEGAVRNQMYKCLKQARRIMDELDHDMPE